MLVTLPFIKYLFMTTPKIKHRSNLPFDFLTIQCPSLLKQLYANRGVLTNDELDNSTKTLLSPSTLKGIDIACDLLLEALESNKKIVIVGDFDADGATSTALSMLAFKALGFTNVDYIVPNRFDYGYGLTPETVDLALEKNAQLLMTVDNGISSINGVAYAKQKGLIVVVTDHHLPAQETPIADAIVNPNQAGCEFESKNLAGVGVAFYLMLALRQALIKNNNFENQAPPNLASLLDIVALGTVADVVLLDKNNRTLVHQGLARIRAGVCRLGISALIQVSKRNQSQLVASDLAFSLGPRINAAGRLDEMSYGVELLLCDDADRAMEIATELDGLNKSRREIEQGMQQEALQTLKSLTLDEANIPYAICLYNKDWHQGVIGLVASRIKERYYRPTFAFASGNEGEIKASARSIPGVHIRDMLDLVDKKIPGSILKFGGHAMAAGLRLKESDFELFEKTLNRVLESNIEEEVLTNVVLSDGVLTSTDFTLETAQALRDAGPWGQGFPSPLFDGEFTLLQQRLVGEKHLKLTVDCDGVAIDGIAFNVDLSVWPNPNVTKIHCVYRLEINEFRGRKSVQLLFEYLSAL